jgi:flagellar M-ring protein FliF
VPRELVYKTRLKLMGKDVPLHGAVGFEVFNNADFGMTEFVQKVNYLRAIQGELTRTILSIDDIQAARVHLALTEQGLFKKSWRQAQGLGHRDHEKGRVLAPEQVAGIQRLVAASVPDISSGDVTVLNQHGVALTRNLSAEAGMAMAAAPRWKPSAAPKNISPGKSARCLTTASVPASPLPVSTSY